MENGKKPRMPQLKVIKCDCGGRVTLGVLHTEIDSSAVHICLECNHILARFPKDEFLKMMEENLPKKGEDTIGMIEVIE